MEELAPWSGLMKYSPVLRQVSCWQHPLSQVNQHSGSLSWTIFAAHKTKLNSSTAMRHITGIFVSVMAICFDPDQGSEHCLCSLQGNYCLLTSLAQRQRASADQRLWKLLELCTFCLNIWSVRCCVCVVVVFFIWHASFLPSWLGLRIFWHNYLDFTTLSCHSSTCQMLFICSFIWVSETERAVDLCLFPFLLISPSLVWSWASPSDA